MDKMTTEQTQTIMDNLFNDTKDITIQLLERIWFRNILYYMGEQWFEWARGKATFKKILPTPFLPTPVSNIIRDYVRSIKSLILNKDYAMRIWPNSNDQDDKDSAEMGEKFLRWMETRRDEDELDEKEMTAIWMILCGTSFDRVYPDMEDGSWAFDSAGNPVKTGDIAVESMSPFMVRVDHYGRKLKQKRWVGIKSLKPREWVEDTFKVKVGASTEASVVDYERRLSQLVANVSTWKGEGIDTGLGKVSDEDMVLFKEIEFRPTKAYPRGRYVIGCDDKIIKEYNRMPIPVEEDGGKWFYTLTDYHYQYVPGRYYSDSGVNDLISPQNTINQIDQDLETNRRGVGSPWVLLGTDVILKRVSGYGQKLTILKYDPFLSAGIKPEVHSGTALPEQVLAERAIHRAAAQDAAGDPKNVLRGNAPSAQASGVMVDILRDAAEQGHGPDIDRFYRSVKRGKRKQLILAQAVFTEERMIKVPDKSEQSKVISFRGTDLRGNTDVRMEKASGMASTKTGQSQMLLKLTESGFFNGQSDIDPEHRNEMLRLMGLTGFRDKRNVDVDRAVFENNLVAVAKDDNMGIFRLPDPETGDEIQIPVIPGLFLSMGSPDPQSGEGIVISDDPLFKYDNHQVHYESHRRFILSAEFRELDREIQQFMISHTDIHNKMIEAQQAQEAQKVAMMNQLAGVQPPAAGANGGGRSGRDLKGMPGAAEQIGIAPNVVV